MKYWELISYLQKYLYTSDFVNEYTRPQLVQMLNTLYASNKNICFKRRMCKERQVQHLKNYLTLHNIKCEGE